MTLYVVRHAHAGERSAWVGDDRLRPLSGRGELQSQGLAATLASCDPEQVLSSPARRCVQTVEPLADELGVPVVEDDRLFEGAGVGEIRSLLDQVANRDAVLCSHGDVIPVLLDLLVDAGLEPERNLVWQKASVWVAERRDGGWGRGRYVPPPDRA
ncbi:MAG TPA: phosphoglycerate mutase family protein [Acidimicrobiales bacterium]|nr:phosphoglycerate mutase family protein [Acidimicrobiales bacterium]